MGFLDDLVARSEALFTGPLFADAKPPTEQHSVVHDSFDELDWKLVQDNVPAIENNVTDLHRKYDYVPHFFEDFFNLLHQGDPLLRDAGEMDERFRPNQVMTDDFHKMPEIAGLRLSTMHDPYATAMAMLSMQPKLKDAYERMGEAMSSAAAAAEARAQAQAAAQALAQALAEAQNAQQQADSAQQAADAAQGGDGAAAAEAAAQAAQGAADQAAQAAADALGQAEAAAQAHADASAQAGQQAKGAMAEARASVRSAAHHASNEAEEESQLMRAFGVADGELKAMDFEERRKLAERLRTNRMAKFAKVIGQFRVLADAERRRKTQHKPDQVVGVELGGDLMRMTAGEMLNLAEPELETDFWRRWASQELVQYKVEGSEKLGQGPIVVVCDESGSMAGSPYGGVDLQDASPEAWSKALSLALCDQARRSGRDFHYIGFSSASQQWHLEFPGGKAPIAKVIEFTEHFYSGGTHYEKPLRMAKDIVERYGKRDKPKPDVVFITDEEYGELDPAFLQDWQRVKHDTSMRVFGIAVGTSGGNGALRAVADDVRVVSTLASDPRVMADLFRVI
jgi:uncharacterized protein with von Willebrand factor type A (vWA) domain